jgi:cephalosporin hydroxylase
MDKNIKNFVISLMRENPYENFDTENYTENISGWNYNHPIFERLVSEVKPNLFLEIGTWFGASAIHMHNCALKRGLNTSILCIDTWLGLHRILWKNPEFRQQLNLKNGYPQQYAKRDYSKI